MPPQPDLLASEGLKVTPADGLTGPRLWVRRLVVWREPGGEIVRDIHLRPGLNIIWSPDNADSFQEEEASMGHGSGKTLLCRLLRYCLGEDRFAPDGQRERIGEVFPDGIVGAEVMLDGTPWAVVRPLGARRRHMAVPDGDLEEIAAGKAKSTGLGPLYDAIENAFLSPELAQLIPGPPSAKRSWLIALAWLARDQECRLNRPLGWRDTASSSDSPASGLNETEKLDALRAFLRAITKDEHDKRNEIASLKKDHHVLEQEIGHRQWQIDSTRARLIDELELDGDGSLDFPLALETFRRRAQARLAAAARLPASESGAAEIEVARSDYENARDEAETLERDLTRLDTQISEIPKIISKIEADIPPLSWSKEEAQSPLCPICEVPIDRALAEGCCVSRKLPDLETCQQRLERRQRDLKDEQDRLNTAKREQTQIRQKLAIAKQNVKTLKDRLDKLEKARDAKEKTWYSARRCVDDVARLAELIDQQDKDRTKLQELESQIEMESQRLSAFRDRQARVFGLLTEKFDPIVRELLGAEARGTVSFDGNGLGLTIQMGGNRSSAAIDSLKILAFDVAALCLSMEGATHVPAFLVHDSPREADLGLTLYHRLFQLVRRLEGDDGRPLFQYIITTTTQPPPNMAKDPYLRLTLRGVPANERLLRYDL